MKNMRKQFTLFCMRNREKGIPNLMLYVCIGNAIVYLMYSITGNYQLYSLLKFDQQSILHGQIWRLISYPLTMYSSNLLLMFISLFCYYSLGQAMERQWGTLRFNLFYLTGLLLMDVYSMLTDASADVYYLNMSLFIGFATLYPEAQFLLFFIIPIKAWIFALFDLAIVLFGVFTYSFPNNLLPLVSIGNYILFFGWEVLNLLPPNLRLKAARLLHRNAPQSGPKVIQFRTSPHHSTQSSTRSGNVTYRHKCTVCGRTDVSDPNMEFRYCSKCTGYHCYCQDHISNHAHIQ